MLSSAAEHFQDSLPRYHVILLVWPQERVVVEVVDGVDPTLVLRVLVVLYGLFHRVFRDVYLIRGVPVLYHELVVRSLACQQGAAPDTSGFLS